MPRIKISSAKAKGRNLQRWVAEKISNILSIPFGNEDYNLIQSRPMGQSGTDVILRGKAKIQFPFAIECKSTEHLSLMGVIKQARDNLTEQDDTWLLFHKRKALKQPIVILDANYFFELLKRLHHFENEIDFE